MEAKIITIVGGGSTYTPGVVKAILSKKNTTVIMVTHHLREEIKQLANEVINLNEVKE